MRNYYLFSIVGEEDGKSRFLFDLDAIVMLNNEVDKDAPPQRVLTIIFAGAAGTVKIMCSDEAATKLCEAWVARSPQKVDL